MPASNQPLLPSTGLVRFHVSRKVKRRAALAMMMRRLNHHPATTELGKVVAELFDLRLNPRSDGGRRLHMSESNLFGGVREHKIQRSFARSLRSAAACPNRVQGSARSRGGSIGSPVSSQRPYEPL